ncbi:sialidase family protein [Nonomuraea sp. NPDC050202]|uniref:sialidase family protein n=1 Tax=Nonomuraea sp. NPDC050202 TaxID=3155035 RepID=UPI0033EFBCEA
MPSPARRRVIGGLVTVVTATLLLSPPPTAAAGTASEAVPLTELASDAYANSTAQYGTSAGPDTYQWDSTIVTAQQAGRFHDGGASGITFATSTDNGGTWTKGTLPAITAFGGGPYGRVSDPSAAFDAEHGAWLITSLALTDAGGVTGAAVLTSRSTDGGLTWSTPVTTATGGDLDKSWAVCDNGADSAFRGTCYAVFDDHAAGNAIKVARSTDGGLTWAVTGTSANGLGGQPVVRPDGAVVVPYLSEGGEIRSFRSRDGGASWGESVLVSRVQRHTVAGGLRAAPLPSAEVDAAGTVYVVWQDCRFQVRCAGNDIVLSTSANGTRWGEALRVTEDGGDHFIPGLGVDRESSGGDSGKGARLALAYYRYPDAACAPATCRLTVAYTSSTNGGASWSPPLELHAGMALDWLANSTQGRTVGDYISTSVVPGGGAFPAFAVAGAPAGGAFNVRTHTVTGGLPITGGEPPTIAIEAAVASGEPPAGASATAR